jgi:hypothetical protein
MSNRTEAASEVEAGLLCHGGPESPSGNPTAFPLGPECYPAFGEEGDHGQIDTDPICEPQERKIGKFPSLETNVIEIRRDTNRYHTEAQIEKMKKVYTFIYSQFGYEFQYSYKDDFLWWKLGLKEKLESYLKWKTAELVAKCLRQDDLPPLPGFLSNEEIPSGLTFAEGRFWSARWNSQRISGSFIQFAFSVYQGKAGSLAVPEHLVQEKVLEAMKRLSTTEETVEAIAFDGQYVTMDDIYDQLSRTVEEIYPKRKTFREGPPREDFAASIRSSVEATRGDGGPMEWLTRNRNYLGFDHLLAFARNRTQICEIRVPYDPDDWDHALELSRRIAWQSADRVLAYPVGLVEPFKVRVITRGQADVYHLGRRYQGELWRPLKNHPAFRLVGEPLSQEVLNSFLSRCETDPNLQFLSGDYEAATDYFHSELSEFTLTSILQRIGADPADVPCLVAALTRHRLVLTDKQGEAIAVCDQRRGQLMGSPISFPILCIYNAALSRFAIELRMGRRLDLDEMPMLVNGDDLLLQTDEKGFHYWKEVTRFGGLRCSIGKTYLSRRALTLNSELWFPKLKNHKVVPSKELEGTIYWTAEAQKIPQMGLVTGSIKGGLKHNGWRSMELPFEVLNSEESLSSFNTRGGLSQRWEDFLESCPSKDLAWDWMWEHNFDNIRDAPRGTAACLPVWLGGLGVPLPPPSHRHYQRRLPSPMQRIVANYISQNWLGEAGKKVRRLIRRTDSPQYLKLIQMEDRRISKRLGCELEIVEALPRNALPCYNAEPLVPFPMTGFLPSGSLLPENIQVPEPRPKKPKQRSPKTLEGIPEEMTQMQLKQRAAEKDYRSRLRVWRELQESARKSKLPPLHLQWIRSVAPQVKTVAYALV